MLDRQCGELIALTEEKTDRPQRARVDLEQGCKGCIEVAFGACIDDMSVQPKRARSPRRAAAAVRLAAQVTRHPMPVADSLEHWRLLRAQRKLPDWTPSMERAAGR